MSRKTVGAYSASPSVTTKNRFITLAQDDDAFLASIDLPGLPLQTTTTPTEVAATGANTNNFKPFTYFYNVDRTVDGVEIIKGCIVTLASKLTIIEDVSGTVWSVKVC